MRQRTAPPRTSPRPARPWVGLWLVLLGLAAAACQDAQPGPLRASKAASRHELVGGPVAYADVGDFVLENDKVRVAILGTDRSWGPGVFGGSLVDADVRRSDARYPSGQGRDKLAEIFPFANLLVPAPVGAQVRVLKDGADGKEAVVRVEGKGMFLFEALSILERQRPILGAFYPDIQTAIDFRTDYILRPGDRFVTMRTWVILKPRPLQENEVFVGGSCKTDADCSSGPAVPSFGCRESADGKSKSCQCKPLAEQGCAVEVCSTAPNADAFGCPSCGCSAVVGMTNTAGAVSVFDAILGDSKFAENPQRKAGVGGGDFVFFGNQTDIFVPGHGFDEEKPVWDALFGGRDTFGDPLAFDFVSAAGGEVSYAYYTKRQQPAATGAEPQVLVPVFTSAATAFVTASKNCLTAADDDKTCEGARVFEYERYLAIGEGDVGSVSDIVWRHRGTTTGTVRGYVRWQQTGQPATNATVFVLRDPDPGQKWTSAEAVIAANRAKEGSPGVVNAIDADRGTDLREDGDFEATLPKGAYVLVAMDAKKVVAGPPLQIEVKGGDQLIVAPSLPAPARLQIHAVDQGGGGVPAKVTVVKLDAKGQPLFRDGGRMPYFGQGRLGIGVERLGFAMDGHFDVPLQAGTYQVVVSHGTEWSIHDQTVTLRDGDTFDLRAALRPEIDSTGWISGDFHLHAEPSFDSGMPLGDRVQTIAAEGVDYVASTDHDVLSDYLPWLRKFGLDQWLKAVVGSEISTLEIGHYIGFPLTYHQGEVPSHGSVDWYCKPSPDILQAILAKTGLAGDGRPNTIIAHPRDGFLGWLDQAGVNGYSMTRTLSSLESGNPVLRTVACDHDAMEVFNGKRFDMTHTATVKEVQVFSRCLDRIDRAGTSGGQADPQLARTGMAAACPELADRGLQNVLGSGGKCPDDEDLATCKMRYRMALAHIVAGDINRRTPAEQAAWLQASPGQVAGEAKPEAVSETRLKALKVKCEYDPDKLALPFDQAVPPADWDLPCGKRDGVLSDYFRLLEHGLVKGIVGGSDSHGYKQEPGLPRTYIRAATDTPGNLDPKAVGESLRAGHTVPSYGPLIDVQVDGAGPGDTVQRKAGETLKVRVKVQTASWFGVDRVEVYLNGEVAKAFDLPPDRKRIVDFDQVIELAVPARDSHVVVVAVGTDAQSLMRPVYLDVPFGELQLARVASIAFSALFGKAPGLSAVAKNLIPPPAKIPDFFPVFPMAVSGAVLVDQGGDGRYDAPLPMPAFCSPRCDTQSGEILEAAWDAGGKRRTCKDLQSDYQCLQPEGRCGLPVPGVCDIYAAQKQGALRNALGTH